MMSSMTTEAIEIVKHVEGMAKISFGVSLVMGKDGLWKQLAVGAVDLFNHGVDRLHIATLTLSGSPVQFHGVTRRIVVIEMTALAEDSYWIILH